MLKEKKKKARQDRKDEGGERKISWNNYQIRKISLT